MTKAEYNTLDASDPELLPWWRTIATENGNGPSLVFADWLEERGDPRAAFIRESGQPAVAARSLFCLDCVYRDSKGVWYPIKGQQLVTLQKRLERLAELAAHGRRREVRAEIRNLINDVAVTIQATKEEAGRRPK